MCFLLVLFLKIHYNAQLNIFSVDNIFRIRNTGIRGVFFPAVVPRDCLELFEQHGIHESGPHYISPDNKAVGRAFCDMKTDGGGWTVWFICAHCALFQACLSDVNLSHLHVITTHFHLHARFAETVNLHDVKSHLQNVKIYWHGTKMGKEERVR